MKFTGWVPTITGRMSFSRVGASFGNHNATTCNRSRATPGYIFGAERRISRDAPLPNFIMSMLGRLSGTNYFTFLQVSDADLPVPDGGNILPKWKLDQKGELTGPVIVALGSRGDRPSVAEAARKFRTLARKASQFSLSSAEIKQNGDDAKVFISDFWNSLVAAASTSKSDAPAFARAHVTLKRTGVCEIEIEGSDLYNSSDILSLRASGKSDAEIEASPEGKAAAAQIARHVFFFMRDLAHRHYHHKPHSDQATMAYYADPGDDETWRRETQYSLVRMAISARREDAILSYRQASGMIAYAEAFQHHLALWCGNKGSTRECSQVFPYDFGALRASMDSSLAGKEAELSQKREAIIYLGGSFLAVLGVILGSGQIWKADEVVAKCINAQCWLPNSFWYLTKFFVERPWLSLAAILLVVFFLLIIFGKLFGATGWFASIRGGVSRLVDALLGTFMVFRTPLVSWGLTLLAGFAAVWLGWEIVKYNGPRALAKVQDIVAPAAAPPHAPSRK